MSNNSQSLYEDVSKKLSMARHSGNSSQIKVALGYFSNLIKEIVENTKDEPLALSPLIYDKNMLFRTVRRELSNNGPDIEIKTTGLIAQMLDMIMVKNYEKISDDICEALYDIHSQLSRGNRNITKEHEQLIVSLKSIDDLL